MKTTPDSGHMTFYREWLPLDKKDFRILAMLADKGTFTGNLSDLCRYFAISAQSKHRTHLRNSIQKLAKEGFINCRLRGRTYTLSPIPKATKIVLPRRWAEPIIRHEYCSNSVAWEQVLRVFLWIYQNKIPVVQNIMIEEDLNISTDTITSAKNVLDKDFHSIIRELEKITLADGSKRNIGQRLAAVAEWSE